MKKLKVVLAGAVLGAAMFALVPAGALAAPAAPLGGAAIVAKSNIVRADYHYHHHHCWWHNGHRHCRWW